MEDLLFERLERMPAKVDPEIVLQDLYFVDRVVRPTVGIEDGEYRMPFLLECLEARGFCADADAGWEAVELYDDLCDLCAITTFAGLARVLDRVRAYRARDPSAVEDR